MTYDIVRRWIKTSGEKIMSVNKARSNSGAYHLGAELTLFTSTILSGEEVQKSSMPCLKVLLSCIPQYDLNGLVFISSLCRALS